MTAALSLFERLGAYILTWSWQMAVLFLFAWIAVSLDRRHRPTLRHRLWVLTLLFGLLLPWIPERIAAQSFAQEVRQVLMPPTAESRKPDLPVAENALRVPPAAVGNGQDAAIPHAGLIAPSGWNVSRTALLRAAGLLWVVGAVVAAFRRMREYWRVRRIASNARMIPAIALAIDADASTPPILLSPGVRSPMLYGWFQPVILLPENVSNWSTPEERATMIRHESVHYVRKDHWISAFEALVRTVFFFHPLVRWTCRQVDIERELACDEEVLRRGVEPATYAEAILKVAEHAFAGRASCGVYFSATAQLDRRVDLLFRTPPRVNRPIVLLLPLILLSAPTFALGFWQARTENPGSIEFKIEVNPVGMIPAEILAPAPKPTLIAAVVPPSMRSQDPLVNPAAPAPPTPRIEVAFFKVTESEIMVNIALRLPYSQLTFKDDLVGQLPVRRASGSIEGQVTNLTGRIISRMEDPFIITAPATGFSPAGVAVYQKTLYLRPGLYRLFVLINDLNSGNAGTIDTRLEVPRFSADTLAASSLILADLIEPLPLRAVDPAFRIGSLRVHPSMSERRRDQDLNIFQRVYVAAKEMGSTLPLLMETLITLDGREIKRVSEELQRSADVTVTRKISLADFTPGSYAVQTTYTDAASGERVVSTGQFSVK